MIETPPILATVIEPWPIAKLVPYSRNARTHSDTQVKQIAASITQFGFINPILVDGNRREVLAGHGRLQASRLLGLEVVPVIVVQHLTDAQRRAYIIADNKLALNAGWDEDLLALELKELNDLEFDLGFTGFDDAELQKLLAGDEPEPVEVTEGPAPEFDKAAALQLKWGTERGQVWTFGGGHRLACGDSTNAADVARLMGDRRAALCFSSPPYANQRTYKSGGIGDWDALMVGVYSNLFMEPDGQVLVNLGLVHSDGEWLNYWDGWIENMRGLGWRRFGWYVWHQGAGMPGDWAGRLAPSHEFIFHFNREARRPHKIVECKDAGGSVGKSMRSADGSMRSFTTKNAVIQDTKIPDSVVSIQRAVNRGVATIHPAVFPVAFPAFIMQAWTDPKEVCYEPFAGSGTQFLAAQQLKRVCYGMELAPEYCGVILERMAQAGLKPERAEV